MKIICHRWQFTDLCETIVAKKNNINGNNYERYYNWYEYYSSIGDDAVGLNDFVIPSRLRFLCNKNSSRSLERTIVPFLRVDRS